MRIRTSFYKASAKEICTVLFISFCVAFLSALVVWWFSLRLPSPLFESWKGSVPFAAIGFCGCLSFYAEKYTGLGLLGFMIGFTVGTLMIAQTSTEPDLLADIISAAIPMGLMWGFMGWFLVMKYNLF